VSPGRSDRGRNRGRIAGGNGDKGASSALASDRPSICVAKARAPKPLSQNRRDRPWLIIVNHFLKKVLNRNKNGSAACSRIYFIIP
jgi:hypothetical protein